MSTEFEYVVWFRDPSRRSDDEDFEWPAVFVISANGSEDALQWGDVLARDYAARTGQRFLWSKIDDDPTLDARLPRVRQGDRATDRHIGW